MSGPRWWREAVFYQIYPRSFQDSDGDGVGDLPGIVSRLDYLRGGPDALGVDAIWLCPFYPSPLADFGYDVADFTAVDPRLGTLDDVRTLLAEAHRRGLKVIIDWVPNHTSDQHPWFLESRASRSNPKRGWYVWRPAGPDGRPPNNWMSDFAEVGPAWKYDELTAEWYLHSFTPSQPDLDWDNPDVRRAMLEAVDFWLELGVDGFRIDVVNKLGKDPALRDNAVAISGPGLVEGGQRHDEDWDSTFPRLAEIRERVSRYPDRVTVGEVYVMSLERLARYVGPDRLDLAHNFVFMNLPWQAEAVASTIDATMQLLRGRWPAWCIGNHDHSRAASRYAGGGDGERRARAAAVIQLALRGTPFIYQGEEIGLGDLGLRTEECLDVAGRDRFRGPQPWAPPSEAGPGAGFTSGRSWIPLNVDAEQRNVRDQARDAISTFSLYRHLLALRRDLVALRRGSYRSLGVDGQMYGFVRQQGGQRVLALVNFGRWAHRFRCETAGLHGPAELIASSVEGATRRPIELCRLGVEPDEAMLIRLPAGR